MPADERSLERLLRHPHGELVETLAAEDSFVTRAMFGCCACYVHGRLVAALAAGDPPWDGVLVPTGREHHASLQAAFPRLRVHPVLGKWLYLPAEGEEFERDARRLADLARADDPRIGVEPRARRPRRPPPGRRPKTTRRRRRPR